MELECNNFRQGYSAFYLGIMRTVQLRTYDGYVEKHHVVPRSLGGSNASSNIVKLTPREHLVAHRLLIRMTDGKERSKMIFALQCMTWDSPKHKGQRVQLSVKQHALLREKVANARFGSKWTGEQRRNQSLRKRGLLVIEPKQKIKRVMSEAQKEKIRASLKGRGRPHTEETKAKLSALKLGKPGTKWTEQQHVAHAARMTNFHHTDETKARLSASHRGLKASDETRAKMSATRRAKGSG